MKPIAIIGLILLTLVIVLWIGLKVRPKPFPPFVGRSDVSRTIPLPDGLPSPVDRFYRATYGETVPVITSAVLSGRGTMAPVGFDIPMRFRFIYGNAIDYRSRIEATIFNLPIMKVDETYLDGHAYGKMPYGIDQGTWFDQAMNVRIWCEILSWFPAALLTDPRVRWEPVDDTMAILVVPFGEKQERVLVRFDPLSGEVAYFEAMKYRKEGDQMLWINATWFDQGKRWIVLNVEDKLFNADVKSAVR